MPAEVAGAETRKNPILFKNHLQEAESKLKKAERDDLAKALERAKGYIKDYDFWQHQDSGLAFYISAESSKYYRLPYSFTSQVVVSDRFYLKPLIPLIANNRKFHLLSLAQNQVEFVLGDRDRLNKIDLPPSVPPV